MVHTTAFVIPVIKHCLEREISQWVHHKGSIRFPIDMIGALPQGYVPLPHKSQWRRKVPKSVCVCGGGGGGGGAHRYVIYVPSVKNQYKRVVFGYMVIY